MPSNARRHVPVALALSLIASPVLAATPAPTATDAKPPCAEVVKLPPRTFIEQTRTRLKDGSEVAEDEAAERWAECKAEQNRERLKADAKLGARLTRLHALEEEFRRLSIQLASLRTGGGSMYAHGQRRSGAFLEEHHGALIALRLDKPSAPAQKALEARARVAQKKLNAYLKVVRDSSPDTSGAAPDEAKQKKAEWTQAGRRFHEVHGLLFGEFELGKSRDPFAVAILEYLVAALWELG